MDYLVMECHPGYAVVLDAQGRFIKVANLRYEVGQTVSYVTPLTLPQDRSRSEAGGKRRWRATLAAMAACLALFAASLFAVERIPTASVFLSINPEVRIDVNHRDTVVGVDGINRDGAALLEGYDHRRKDLDRVLQELADRAVDRGYLREGGRITLTLDADEDWIIRHETSLADHLSGQLAQRITVQIDVAVSAAPQPSPVGAQSAAPDRGQTVVIPVKPDEGTSDYGATDYGASDYGATDYGASDYGATDYGTSDYGTTDYGASDYGEADSGMTDDGTTDYDTTDYDATDDGTTDYDATDYDDTDYGTSDDGESGYDASDYGVWEADLTEENTSP